MSDPGAGAGLARLWAGWRARYVAGANDVNDTTEDRSLFEAILGSGLPDEESLVVWRGRRCAAILNLYPYGSGHLMVLPVRAVAELEELSEAEHDELWAGVRDAVRAVKTAYEPHGVNVGVNLGKAAGAGVPDHLHVHVLPRWAGDTNFMTTVAETRVLPEPLDMSWRKLRAAWPTADATGSVSG